MEEDEHPRMLLIMRQCGPKMALKMALDGFLRVVASGGELKHWIEDPMSIKGGCERCKWE